MTYYFDPADRACRSHSGALACGSELTLHIYGQEGGEADFSAEVCHLILCRDGGSQQVYPMEKRGNDFVLTLKFHEIGLYFYAFTLGSRFFGCGPLRHGKLDFTNNWQITVYEEGYKTPSWIKGGVIYQIFPDRFYKVGEYPIKPWKILREDWGGTPNFRPNEYGKVLNNDFFGGNFQGIRAKLDYIASLNVNAIYLNPIFEAYSNHRYDTGDYMAVDPLLGSIADFDALVEDAKARGIRIILDGVFNHTGDDSRYFNKYGRYDSIGAYQSPDSPYADWYHFRQFPDSYESWWGIETLPAVNEASETYQDFICGEGGVLKTWLAHGVGGYRLDVADELPDFFLQKLRKCVKEADEDAFIIGEVWEDASNKIAYSERRQYLQGYELDSVMNYPLKDAILCYVRTGNLSELRETIAMLIDNYPKETLDCLMNILGTHDTPRILTALGGKSCYKKEEMAATRLTAEERERAIGKLKMAAVLQFTLPGVPCVYYGDEVGMEGYLDPFCRGCFPWEDMDEEIAAFYRRLGEIRSVEFREVFADGAYEEIFAENACIVYARKKGGKRIYIYVNNSTNKYNIRFQGSARELLTDTVSDGRLEIAPYSYGIFLCQT